MTWIHWQPTSTSRERHTNQLTMGFASPAIEAKLRPPYPLHWCLCRPAFFTARWYRPRLSMLPTLEACSAMHASKWHHLHSEPIFGSAVAASSLSWLYLLPNLLPIYTIASSPYSTNAPTIRTTAKPPGLKTASDKRMLSLFLFLLPRLHQHREITSEQQQNGLENTPWCAWYAFGTIPIDSVHGENEGSAAQHNNQPVYVLSYLFNSIKRTQQMRIRWPLKYNKMVSGVRIIKRGTHLVIFDT